MTVLKLLTMTATVLGLVGPVYGNAIFTLGNNPQPDEENVLFLADQTGTTVQGATNISNVLVNFTSTTDTLEVTASGQANLTSSDGRINNVSISLAGGATFQDMIFNPFLVLGTSAATVTVTTNDGTQDFSYPSGLQNGQNFLTITTENDETISDVTINSALGFGSLRQVRVSGIAGGGGGGGVPEPGTFSLITGAGLLLVAKFRRRRA
jgi:hypothetical protein